LLVPLGSQWGQISIRCQEESRIVPQRWQKGLPVSQPDECLQLAHLLCILGRQLPHNEMKRNTSLRFVAGNRRLPPPAATGWPLRTGQWRPGAPMAAAPGELLTLANQGLVNRAGEQGDARAGNLVAEMPAGDAHLGGAGGPQHGVIEIGPLLRLTKGSHQFFASTHVLAGRLAAVNRCWARLMRPLAGRKNC